MTHLTTNGVRMKYIIEKADGSDVDPNACYFILRLDADEQHGEACRKAMRVYADECGNQALADDINACLDWLDDPPKCTCGGGRDRDVICPFHDGGMFGHPVWRHSGWHHR